MGLKRLLNLSEEATHLALKKACERHEGHVYSKVRCADVVPIERSGIEREYYDYALRAHFDFVISDSKHGPLFAVEFDGPSHDDEEQKTRDAKKDWLAKRFELPLLRITARYLGERYRDMDLLTWFVEAWFAKQWYDAEQAAGRFSHDEPFSPIFMTRLEGFEKDFPLWISGPVLRRVQKLFLAGKLKDFLPSHTLGQGSDGTYHGIAWVLITDETAVCAELAMRDQNFPIWIPEALRELVLFELGKAMNLALENPSLALAKDQVKARIRSFNARVARPMGGNYGEMHETD